MRAWPPLLAVGVVSAVGAPAAVASYRHARDVVSSTGDTVMAPWLPLSVDGLLVAALVVIWVRRRRGERAGRGPWGAFLFGMVVTIGANLAAVTEPAPTAFAVALFPPLAFAITLELVALVAHHAPSSTRTVADLVASRIAPTQTPTPAPEPVPAELPVEAPAALPPADVEAPTGDPHPDLHVAPMGAPDGDTQEAGDLLEQAIEWARREGSSTGTTPGRTRIQAQFPDLSEDRARTAAREAKTPAPRGRLRRVQ